MHKAALVSSANALIVLALASFAVADSREVKEPDPLLRGVWKAHSVSKDSGKTVETIVPIIVATVYAHQIKGPKGDLSAIEKIVEVHDKGAEPVHLIKLANGVVWTATQRKEPGSFMLQIMSGNPLKEVIRFGVKVEK